MVLESTMICIDTSDYMRNGDFPPTRLHAQQDAVYLLSRSKLHSHPENKVGLLTLVNQQVLTNLTNDIGHLYSKLHQLQPNGGIDLYRGIKTAHLALKHREGKNHKTRIIVFIASPVTNEDTKLTNLAKQLKKEKVTVDIISFGEDKINADKLDAFISTLNGKDGTNHHLVTVPEGHNVSDTLLTSSIIESEIVAETLLERGQMGLGFEDQDDPELAMALFLSLQEEEARINRANAMTAQVNDESDESVEEEDDKNLYFDDVDFSQLTDVQQLMYALRMSFRTDSNADVGDDAFFEMIKDPDFMEGLLNNWPELHFQSEDLSEAIRKLQNDRKPKNDGTSDEDK